MADILRPTNPDTDADSAARDALGDIATTLTDLIKGYEEMTDRAEADLAPVVQRLLVLHRTHAAEIFEAYRTHGGDPAQAGSAMGTVHKAVATVRDWLDKLDASALDAIADGEEQIVGQYDSAIEKIGADPRLTDLLARQRDDLRAQITALRA